MEKLGFAVIAVFWWIALWGLTELATEGWGRGARAQLYLAILIGVSIATFYWPEMVEHF